MLGLAAAGILLMAAPGLATNAAGAALLYLGFLLDKVDGELARCRHETSLRGILLDRFHHRLVEPALFAAAAAHATRHEASPGALVAAAACMLFANAIEEHQQLAPYILYKHVRAGGALPVTTVESLGLRRLARWLRPLKAARMHIVALPCLLIAYVAEAASGRPVTLVYLECSAVMLGAYLLFQCVDYASGRLESEVHDIAATLARVASRSAGPGDADGAPRPAPARHVASPAMTIAASAPTPERESGRVQTLKQEV
jgi:phosphatidylglycerophosphate synthase